MITKLQDIKSTFTGFSRLAELATETKDCVFDTVEVNNSFYRLPLESALATWRDSTPPNFQFALKGSRYLTHMKKLKDPKLGLQRFFERADLLSEKLGPILFQLPPHWEVDVGRLRSFLEALPSGHRYTFEFRNPTWYTAARPGRKVSGQL